MTADLTPVSPRISFRSCVLFRPGLVWSARTAPDRFYPERLYLGALPPVGMGLLGKGDRAIDPTIERDARHAGRDSRGRRGVRARQPDSRRAGAAGSRRSSPAVPGWTAPTTSPRLTVPASATPRRAPGAGRTDDLPLAKPAATRCDLARPPVAS